MVEVERVLAPFTVKVVRVSPVKVGESPVPTPIDVLNVAPDSATGSVVPSPTRISPSAKTDVQVTAPVPEPSITPPSVQVIIPVPPLGTVRAVSSVNAPVIRTVEEAKIEVTVKLLAMVVEPVPSEPVIRPLKELMAVVPE